MVYPQYTIRRLPLPSPQFKSNYIEKGTRWLHNTSTKLNRVANTVSKNMYNIIPLFHDPSTRHRFTRSTKWTYFGIPPRPRSSNLEDIDDRERERDEGKERKYTYSCFVVKFLRE